MADLRVHERGGGVVCLDALPAEIVGEFVLFSLVAAQGGGRQIGLIFLFNALMQQPAVMGGMAAAGGGG